MDKPVQKIKYGFEINPFIPRDEIAGI